MPTTLPPPESSAEYSSWLMQQWIIAGIVSASARFIPVPLVDDMVRHQCRRFAVSRTLAAHDAAVPLDRLKAYYGSNQGCLAKAVGLIARLPLKLLLFPVRKIWSVLTSVRGVPLEIMRVVLLGRTLDRYLRQPELAEAMANDSALPARMQVAFNESFARMDFRVVRAALIDALSSVGGWKAAAVATARKLVQQKDVEEAELEPEPKVESSATQVHQVLDRPETAQLFAEFDRRFDEALQRPA